MRKYKIILEIQRAMSHLRTELYAPSPKGIRILRQLIKDIEFDEDEH